MSALPPEVHAARWLHEPDLSPVPEYRESRVNRPGPGRTPILAVRDAVAERVKGRSLPRAGAVSVAPVRSPDGPFRVARDDGTFCG